MKTPNLKLLALALSAAGFIGLTGIAQAGDGIFGSDIGLQLNGGNTTFYELDLLGDSRHEPIASSTVTLPVDLNTSGFNGLNIGTFNINTDSLMIVGGGVLTFKNGSSDVTGATVAYSIDGGAFQFLNLGFNEDNVSGNTGDQRWASNNSAVNVLAGLTNGTHTISTYTFATANDGTLYDNNGGPNYTATFTVVPEPSTWGMVLCGFGILLFFQRKRRLGGF